MGTNFFVFQTSVRTNELLVEEWKNLLDFLGSFDQRTRAVVIDGRNSLFIGL
jgi:hypothetical protein